MNKKGFTIVELILVITLMAIISVLVIPNILDALNSSKQQKYVSLYKLVEKNMKLYNSKYEVDLWNINSGNEVDLCEGDSETCSPGINKLKESGSDINLDNCNITKMKIIKNDDGKYKYDIELNCNANNDNDNWISCSRNDNDNDIECHEYYYESLGTSGKCSSGNCCDSSPSTCTASTYGQYKYTGCTAETATKTTYSYKWIIQSVNGSCVSGVNCCNASSSKTCSSSNVGNIMYTGCSTVRTCVSYETTYTYSSSYRCLKNTSSGRYFFSSADSGGGTCSGSSSCCKSFTCNSSTLHDYKYTGCSSHKTCTSYSYNYKFNAKRVCRRIANTSKYATGNYNYSNSYKCTYATKKN